MMRGTPFTATKGSSTFANAGVLVINPPPMRTALLVGMLIPALAQGQIDYLANNPTWTVQAVCNQAGWGGGPCITTDTYNYQLAGDSVVGGFTYARVVRSGSVDHMWTGAWPPPETCMGSTTYSGWPGGLMRQEGQALYTWNGASDILLFDFDLEVGQTLPLMAYNSNDQILVTAMDSVEMNGEWRHRFTVEGDWSQYIIEGVGSDKGLFEPVSSSFECGFQLACFGLNGTGYYPGPGPDCDMHVGVTEQEAATFHIGFDPTTAHLTLYLPEGAGVWPVAVFDANGRACVRTSVYAPTAQLDISTLSEGAYVVCAGPYRERVMLVQP